jgi:hypothetical protein
MAPFAIETDEELTREDYIELVDRISRDFLTGVPREYPYPVVATLVVQPKDDAFAGMSRTERAGELVGGCEKER